MIWSEKKSISITSSFWKEWQNALITQGIQHQWEMCEETGRLENFRKVARQEGEFKGRLYDDSDVYKLLEATIYAHKLSGNWQEKIDKISELIESAQCEDGYINTHFTLNHPDKRYKALASHHEMYCMGHLLEACSAAVENGCSDVLKQVAEKMVAHLAIQFGEHGRVGFCGHQELELALMRWFAVSGDEEAAKLSRRMTDLRGQRPSVLEAEFEDEISKELVKHYKPLVFKEEEYLGEYCQDDKPLRDQTNAVGHSVRAMYQFCGALDGYLADSSIISALESIWDNMVTRRMYITGGIGSASRNEGFTNDYDLPNAFAYCESCAGIGLALWSSRMARATNNFDYMETFERVVLNNVLAGISLDACTYHYVNPLASDGTHRRQPWYECACCPPNLARFIVSLDRYVVWPDSDSLNIGLLVSMKGEAEYEGGELSFEIESGWPWNGGGRIKGINNSGKEITLRVRQFGHEVFEHRLPVGKFHVEVQGEFSTEMISAHPDVADNVGKVAVMHGPIVYCLEEKDFKQPVSRFLLESIESFDEASDKRQSRMIKVRGQKLKPTTNLYQNCEPVSEPTETTLIPYFAWNNGVAGSMTIWLNKV